MRRFGNFGKIRGTQGIGAALLSLTLASACLHPPRTAGLLSAQMPLSSYLQNRLTGRPGNLSLDFPVLELYDSSGVLVYRKVGDAPSESFLRSLPRGVSRSGPKIDSRKLSKVLDDVPLWNANRTAILGQRRYTLISISLAGCSACTTQQSTLDAVRSRLLTKNIELLTVDLIAGDAKGQ